MFPEKLKQLRESLNLSKKAFAKLCGYTDTHQRRLENGERPPTETMIETICEKFGVTREWLFESEDSNNTESKSIFAQRLKELRLSKNLSKRVFAEMYGYSYAHQRRLENDEQLPNEATIKALTQTFHVTREWLMGEENKELLSVQPHIIPAFEQEGARLRIKELREELGVPVEVFAKMLRSRKNNYAEIESGNKKISYDFIQIVADICDVGAEWIMFGAECAKHHPCNSRMVAFLNMHPELREEIYRKMNE